MSRHATLELFTRLQSFAYRAFTVYGRAFQLTSTRLLALKEKPKHHMCYLLAQEIRFALFRFQSPY